MLLIQHWFSTYLKFRCHWASCILSGNPNCVLTDQKFPRNSIPVLQITVSHKTCCNRLIHCKTMGMEQAAHGKVSGWSWSRWSDEQSRLPPTCVPPAAAGTWCALGCHPQSQSNQKPVIVIRTPDCSIKALGSTLNPHSKATPLRVPNKINLDAQEQQTGIAEAKNKPLTKISVCHHLADSKFMFRLPREVTFCHWTCHLCYTTPFLSTIYYLIFFKETKLYYF